MNKWIHSFFVLMCCMAFADASLQDLMDPVNSMPSKTDVASSIHPPKQAEFETMVTKERVIRYLELELASRYPLEGRLKLHMTQAFNDFKVASENWSVHLIQVPPDKLSQQFNIVFSIVSDGLVCAEFHTILRAELWQEGYMSQHNIARGAIVSEEDFKTTSVDIFRVNGRSVPGNMAINGYIADRDIPAGQLLCYKDLKRRPDIIKGQMVEVIAADGAMRITLKAKALEDGVRGDLIAVQNLESRKSIQAEVMDEKTLRIYF